MRFSAESVPCKMATQPLKVGDGVIASGKMNNTDFMFGVTESMVRLRDNNRVLTIFSISERGVFAGLSKKDQYLWNPADLRPAKKA